MTQRLDFDSNFSFTYLQLLITYLPAPTSLSPPWAQAHAAPMEAQPPRRGRQKRPRVPDALRKRAARAYVCVQQLTATLTDWILNLDASPVANTRKNVPAV